MGNSYMDGFFEQISENMSVSEVLSVIKDFCPHAGRSKPLLSDAEEEFFNHRNEVLNGLHMDILKNTGSHIEHDLEVMECVDIITGLSAMLAIKQDELPIHSVFAGLAAIANIAIIGFAKVAGEPRVS